RGMDCCDRISARNLNGLSGLWQRTHGRGTSFSASSSRSAKTSGSKTSVEKPSTRSMAKRSASRHKFLLEDQNGAELLTVESKLLALQPTMTIERQGQRYATGTKALFTFLHQSYTIQVEGGLTYDADGDITNRAHSVQANGAQVAQITRQWFSIRDAYGIAIAPRQDE